MNNLYQNFKTEYLTPDAMNSLEGEEPEWLNPVIQYMIDHFADDITLDDLAAAVGLSKFNFCRQFHRYRGLPPLKWLWKFRVMLAQELLELQLEWTIQDVAFSCGFSSAAHFSRLFRQFFQSPPKVYRGHFKSVSRAKSKSFNILNSSHCPSILAATQKMSQSSSMAGKPCESQKN